MNRFLNRLILPGLTVAMLSVTGSALASWNDRDCGGKGHDRAKFEQMRERHQTQLHDKLKLDAKQEQAWKSFVAKEKEIRPQQRPDPKELEGLNAPQRMEKMQARMHEHDELMTKRIAALKEFYAQLTPEQQKVFDESMPGPRGHRGDKKQGGDKDQRRD